MYKINKQHTTYLCANYNEYRRNDLRIIKTIKQQLQGAIMIHQLTQMTLIMNKKGNMENKRKELNDVIRSRRSCYDLFWTLSLVKLKFTLRRSQKVITNDIYKTYVFPNRKQTILLKIDQFLKKKLSVKNISKKKCNSPTTLNKDTYEKFKEINYLIYLCKRLHN